MVWQELPDVWREVDVARIGKQLQLYCRKLAARTAGKAGLHGGCKYRGQ